MTGRPRLAFADRLIEAQLNAGFTSYMLARALGVTEEAVSMWRRGVREPRGEMLVRIARVLKRPAEWFYPEREGEQ